MADQTKKVTTAAAAGLGSPRYMATDGPRYLYISDNAADRIGAPQR